MNDAWRNPLMTQGGARAPAAFSGGSSRSNSSPWSVGDGNNDDDDNDDFMKRDEEEDEEQEEEEEEERALLRDILYAFVGVESDCFRLDLACTSFHYYRRGVPASAACLCCTGRGATTTATATATATAATEEGQGTEQEEGIQRPGGLRTGWTTLDSVVVEKVLAPLNAVWRVARFCAAAADARSLTVQCFAAALREHVVEHVALFAARLHALLLRGQLSLSKLLLYASLHVAKPAATAGMLLEVYAARRARRAEDARTLGAGAVAATALLDTLHSRRVRAFVDAVRDEHAADVFERTRRAVVETYVRALALPWMTRGSLAGDVFREFFVRVPLSDSSHGGDMHMEHEEEQEHEQDDDGRQMEQQGEEEGEYGRYGYNVSDGTGGENAVCEERLVPKFIRRQGLEEGVLEAGRCVCLANRGRAVPVVVEATGVDAGADPSETGDVSLARLVAECAAQSNRLLLDTVCGGRSSALVAAFTRLRDRHLFLGPARDVLARFLAHFHDELCREASELRGRPEREAQENRLFREFCRECGTGVPEDDDEGDEEENAFWRGCGGDEGDDDGGWVLECACNETSNSNTTDRNEESREGALLVETVRARVRVPRAYAVLVDGESVRAYETLSTSLVLLRFAEQEFVHAAYRCFALGTARCAASRHAKAFCAALFEMRTLVARLVQFVYDGVVAPGFARLVARASWMLAGGTADVRALRAMHTAFVRECAAASTLADPRCREYLALLLRTVMEYCQLLQAVHANVAEANAGSGANGAGAGAGAGVLDDALAHCVDTRDALRRQLFELLAGWLRHAAAHPVDPADTRFAAAFSDLLLLPSVS